MYAADWFDKALELTAERGWSQAQLAERSGISQTRLSRWKQRKLEMPVDAVPVLARALDLDPVEALIEVELLTDAEVTRYADKIALREQGPLALAVRLRDASEAIWQITKEQLLRSGMSDEEIDAAMRQGPDLSLRRDDGTEVHAEVKRQGARQAGSRAEAQSSSANLGQHPLADEAGAVPDLLLQPELDDQRTA